MGEILKFKRTLYGLKDAPQLCYKHLKEMLMKLGLRSIKNVLCLFTGDQLIVFFYVDGIVVLVHPQQLEHHNQFERCLKAAYDIRSLGDLTWSLDVRVVEIGQQDPCGWYNTRSITRCQRSLT
jgi:hypothetical protein